MEILIYGAGNNGKLVLDLLENDYKLKQNIVGFVDMNKSGKYQNYPIFNLDEIKSFEGIIVIAIINFDIAKDVCRLLKREGYKNIFWFQYKREVTKYKDFFVEQCSNCDAWTGSILQQVEMHIMDSCNLNCKGCAHFSPIFSNDLPELSSRLSDVKMLKDKFTHIIKFYILGGEPFLNPEINKYICEIHKLLPNSELYIVTNGLLIENLSKETLECIKDNRVWISISEYEPTQKKIDTICNILDEYKILYELRKAKDKQKFCLPLSISEHSKYPHTCISDICVTIWNGKISRCPQLMYISYFNTYFKTNLPETGVMSLNNCPEGDALLSILKEEVPLCKHCVKNDIEWEICGKNPKLEDFAVLD